jgi:putative ABC transport system permease protein
MRAIASRLEQLYPEHNRDFGASVVALDESIVGNVRLMLLVFFGAVGLVLLIACANVANLLLAKAAARWHEIAIRSALGGGRARLARQFLTEGLLLAVLGGATALPLAFASVTLILTAAPDRVPRLGEVTIDGTVVSFTMLLSLCTALIFGLAPALRISGSASGDTLKEMSRSASGGRRHSRMRSLLVVSELAISMLLLIGSGLLIRSFHQLRAVYPGFDPHNVTVAEVDLPEPMDKGRGSRVQFYDHIRAGLDRLPGASDTCLACSLPLGAGGSDWEGAVPEGRPFTRSEMTDTQYRRISPGYFRTMRIPLLAGRDFSDSDGRFGGQVVIISQSMARRLWPDEDPIGKRLLLGLVADNSQPIPHQVIGVVGNVKWWRLDLPDDLGSYVPLVQDPMPFVHIVARSDADRANLGQYIRGLIQSISRDLPVSHVRTMDHVLDRTLAERRFALFLISVFGGIALVLAAIGTYGVISCSVAEQTREVGIRMALGANRRRVVSIVVGEAVRLASIGILLGLASAYAVTRVLESLLFQVSPTDPVTFGAISVVLILVSLVASYIPAKKATRIDPMMALRCE